MLEKFLEEIGLSDKEAKVYLALIEVDDDSVLNLARRTGVNRTTIYPVLQALTVKGLVSETQKGVKTHYRAEPPERLQSVLERRKIEIDEQVKRLAEVVPRLRSQMRGDSKPVVKYYEGKQGVLSAMDDFFGADSADGETVHMIYNRDLLEARFTGDERERYQKIRVAAGLKTVAIYSASKELPPHPLSLRRRLPPDVEIKADIAVFRNRVRIITLGERVSSLLIEHPDIADTVRAVIEDYFAWLPAPKPAAEGEGGQK
jgi:sugar-specific transcriptional regulator TrmB